MGWAETATFAHMPAVMFHRLRSFRQPVLIERCEGLFGPLEVCWERGRKVLNSASANQSYGALHRVLRHALPQALEGLPQVRSVLLLGLGGGSAVRILRHELKLDPVITAIELDPIVIDLAARHFEVSPDQRLQVIQADATLHIHVLRERFDLVLVDLFDDSDPARGTSTSGFVHALRDRVAEGGRLCFNTLAYDARTTAGAEQVQRRIERTFLHTKVVRSEGHNRVFIAF